MRDLELVLDSIDEDLVDHVDAHGLLALGTAERMLGYTKALPAGHISFERLDEEGGAVIPAGGPVHLGFECEDMAEMMKQRQPG